MVENWYKRTPENFRSAKFPKVITHDKRLSDFNEDQLSYFFESISELKEKLLALLIQLHVLLTLCDRMHTKSN